MTEEFQTRDESARYEGMTDEEIAALSRDGDGQAMVYLMDKYKNFVRGKARGYFLVGADHEDIVQEGMIGLFKAVRDYDPARLVPFRVFAELCVRRQLITAINAVVNGGYLYRPHVVSSIVDKEGNTVYAADTNPVRQVVSEARGFHDLAIFKTGVTL